MTIEKPRKQIGRREALELIRRWRAMADCHHQYTSHTQNAAARSDELRRAAIELEETLLKKAPR